jgi:ankyrin repeat protein
MVRHLVDSGASVNPTVIHDAAFLGKDDIVAFLLERDADPTIPDDDSNQISLETAEVNGTATTADLLRSTLQCRHA